MVEHVAEVKLVTRAEISPAINKFCTKLSDLQWEMIKKGVWDSDLQAVSAEMIAEMIRSVSVHVLKTVLPAVQRQMRDQESQTEQSSALGKINLSLGDALSASIARALNLPQEACDCTEALTQMIEEEIVNKVNSAVSLLVENPELRPAPAVYVNIKVADIKKLGCMVSQTTSYLKRCAGKMSSLLSMQKIGMPLTAKHKLIIDEALKAIKNNLHYLHVEDEQCTEAENAQRHQFYNAPEKIAVDVINIIIDQLNNLCIEATAKSKRCTKDLAVQCPCTPAEMIATEAVIAIIDKLDAKKRVQSEEKDDFDVGLLVEKVRDSFSSLTSLKTVNEEEIYRAHFFRYARKQFKKFTRGLKQQVMKSVRFFISLEEPDKSSESSGSIDSHTSGEVPEIRHSRSSSHSLNIPAVDGCSSLGFKTIKPNLSKLFDKLTQKEDLGSTKKPLENIHTLECKMFSRQLTDKICDHLQKRNAYSIPAMEREGSILDSVISTTPPPTGEVPFSPEVLYASVEDAVEKFLQKILLWLENEDWDKTVQNDKICSAVKRIQNAFVREMKATEEKESDQLSTSFPQSNKITAPQNETTSCVSAVESETAPIAHTRPTEGQSHPSIPTKPEKEPSEMSRSHARRIARHFMFLLFIRAFEKLKQSFKEVQNGDKILNSVYSLIDLVQYKISVKSLTSLEKNMDDINKALIYRLLKEYGSPKKLLKAALKEDSSFGKSLLKHLKVVIDIYLPRKKPKIGSCFSAVKKAFMKLFRCCCKSTENQTEQDPSKERYETVSRPSRSWSSSSENSQEPLEITPYFAEEILTDFIFLLFLRAFEKSTKCIIRAQNGEKILDTMDSIIDLVMRKVTSAEALRVLDKHMDDLNKAISNRLFKAFGSPEELINAALTENSSFADTLVQHLDSVLDAYSPPKMSRIAAFFSAVGKAFIKPLSCCC